MSMWQPKLWVKQLARQLGYDINAFVPGANYEAHVLALLKKYKVGCVIDVGANAGQWSERLRQFHYRGKIVSFEPLSDAHAQLVRNTTHDPHWHVPPPQGIGAEQATHTINVAGNSQSSSLRAITATHLQAAPESKTIRQEEIAIAPLDEVWPKYLPEYTGGCFLKIDTQGFEKEVLLGATATLKGVDCLQLELSMTTLYDGQTLFPEILAMVEGAGFTLAGLYEAFTDQNTLRILQYDGLFVRL